jgi:hypothetical protein
MEVPPNTKIFSCDAKSIYTNIQTGPALEMDWQHMSWFCDLNARYSKYIDLVD